jgi:glycosidase
MLVPSTSAARGLQLFHDTFSTTYRSPGGAVPTGTNVTLRLRVTGRKAKSVTLKVVAGNPATDTSRQSTVRMTRRGPFWTATYHAPATPAIVSYWFRVRTARGTLWYGDDDSANDTHKGGTGRTSTLQGDAFSLTVYDRAFTTPSWLQGAVVYEIFADRFRNGDPTNDYCRAGSTSGCPVFYGDVHATLHQTWNEPLEDSRSTGVFNRDFFDGDLEGITQKLDYLKSLGVDAVDPALGGDGAFAAFSAAAKANGIRLILDGVFNHTSSDSRYFDRYHRYPEAGACESPSSPYRDWYEITGSSVPCTNYAAFANLDSLPQLNHSSAAVRNFIYRGADSVIRHWLSQGADGWRLDAAQEMDHSWWRDFRTAVKSYVSDAPLIGEVTAGPVDATPYLVGTELDGVMNYRFRQAADGFARLTNWNDSSGTITPLRPSQVAHAIQAMLADYPRQASAVSFNLVDSHDTNRALFVLTEPGDPLRVAKERLELVALLQFTSFGAPMVYYGDEVGINAPGKSGFGDPYNRAPYPWTDASGNASTYGPPDADVLSWYTRLGALRRSLPALRNGSVVTLFTGDTNAVRSDNDVFGFARVAAADKPVIVVLNKGSDAESAQVPLRGLYPNGASLTDAIGGVVVPVRNGAAFVSVPARSGVVLVGTP